MMSDRWGNLAQVKSVCIITFALGYLHGSGATGLSRPHRKV